jgi:ParB/RepB/Spo0J family partition protein
MTELKIDTRNPKDLIPHHDNPRGEIDPNTPEIEQLAEDIGRRGMIQPIVIMPDNKILAGHRRHVAALKAGLSLVPVVIRELEKHEFAEEFFLSENMQRQDLSPFEEAKAIAAVHSKFEQSWKRKVTIADLSRRIDIPKHTITSRLAILKLPERVQRLFHVLEIPVNAASQLARLQLWPEEVEKFADRLVSRGITLNALDVLITKRLKTLNEPVDGYTETDVEKRSPAASRGAGYVTDNAPRLTRASAMENLVKSNGRTLSIFNVKVVFDSTCCSCGMLGNDEVCATCPLPRFVNGLVGRSDGKSEAYE